MPLFKRRKKTGSFDTVHLISDLNSFYTPFGNNIANSDVVKVCIDRITTQCAKLKPRYIKNENDKTKNEEESLNIDEGFLRITGEKLTFINAKNE